MASVYDVAAYILNKSGPMTTMKLQKLIYYSQAWSLAWDDAPLFSERIEAWANGPVCPELYDKHRGQYTIHQCRGGNSRSLSKVQRETVDSVLHFYGDKSSQWLSDLSHSELPWKDARKGLIVGERGSREISHASMGEYYQSLV